MGERMAWVSEEYRGMYVHVMTFWIVGIPGARPPPGQKWGYVVEIRYTAEPDDDAIYGPASDHSDYFTKAAAEQAAFHYGKRAIDVLLALG